MKLVLPAAIAAAAALATPAFADSSPAKLQGAGAAFAADLADAYHANQARHLLVQQGYTGVSALERVAGNRWIGTAVKDGKTLIVGVNLPRPAPAAATN